MQDAHKTRITVNLLHLDTVVRFEPDAIVINNAYDGDRGTQQPGCKGGYAIEGPSGDVSKTS